MSKKVFLSTTLVLIVALMMSGTAFAASGTTTARQVNRIGTITAEGNNSFTLETISGQLFTVKSAIPRNTAGKRRNPFITQPWGWSTSHRHRYL